MNPTMQLGEQ